MNIASIEDTLETMGTFLVRTLATPSLEAHNIKALRQII
jgi:hypothetical protein